MTEAIAHFLLSDAGRDLLDRADREARSDPARALMRLRKTDDPERGGAAWEVREARGKSAAKFGDLGTSMYYTTEALEQASSAGASAYHARRMAEAGVTSVIDLCGGIGADALAFARAGLRVVLCELDPVRALFAAENARVAGLADRIEVRHVDATSVLAELQASRPSAAIWFDPARRVDNRRVGDPEDYRPPLSLIGSLRAAGFKDIGVKLAPAVDHAVRQTYGGELEFISDQGECKEALLWMGALDSGVGVRATVIGKEGVSTLTTESRTYPPPLPKGMGARAHPEAGGEGAAGVQPAGYLYEPDPAVIRAHLVQDLGAGIDAGIIDPHIAYLIGPALVETPFATAYAIVDRFPYHVKALNRALRERSVGKVVIKKRGFPQEPEEVRKQLKLTGDQEMTLVLTRVGQQHQVFLCRLVKR